MSRLDAQILEELKKYSKDDASFKKLEELFSKMYVSHEQLREQLGLLESAIRNDYDSILITELGLEKPGPKIVYVNDGFTKMTGYLPEEVIGKTPRILQGPKTDRAILDRLKRRLIEGQAFFGHSINYRKDGSEFINQWDIHPLLNIEGEVTHWVSYQRDVTEKKETAKAIFNTDFDELFTRTEEFTLKFSKVESGQQIQCKYLTEGFEDLTGLNKAIVFDSGLDAVLHKEDVEPVLTALRKAFSGESSTEYCRYKTSDGSFISMLQSFKPVMGDSGKKVESVKSVAKLELKES
ncbi:MAG: PAS domain S-box protein [Balneolaceae bacterium]|nr:PAS domain S-box protein [Balneolaceae bacterium]MBO6545167.1 PAS domain S-box protein [Balneolaceae bacterium]MBO6646563.1 PAS domain S-box protein [Balneolaceae bacterium]